MLLLEHDKDDTPNNLRDRGPAAEAVVRTRQRRHINNLRERGPGADAVVTTRQKRKIK
jgi:hypothetical protein